MSEPTQEDVPIKSENDIIVVRRVVRDLVTRLSFGVTDVTRAVTQASELAGNISLCAGTGIMWWTILDRSGAAGLELRFEDHGLGISDIELAMKPGHGTSHGLGLGLPGAKRLMDEMEIHSELGKGTTLTVRK